MTQTRAACWPPSPSDTFRLKSLVGCWETASALSRFALHCTALHQHLDSYCSQVIMAGTILAGVATAGTATAETTSGIWAAQVAMGIAQGPLFPSSVAHLSCWLVRTCRSGVQLVNMLFQPPEDRAWASTLLDSGIAVGTMIGLPLSGWLAMQIGWRGTMIAYGTASIVFGLVWHLIACAAPSRCPYITKEEKAYLASAVRSTSNSKASQKLSILKMFSHANIWSLFIAHFAFNFVVYSILNWTPTFYKVCNTLTVHNLSLALVVTKSQLHAAGCTGSEP